MWNTEAHKAHIPIDFRPSKIHIQRGGTLSPSVYESPRIKSKILDPEYRRRSSTLDHRGSTCTSLPPPHRPHLLHHCYNHLILLFMRLPHHVTSLPYMHRLTADCFPGLHYWFCSRHGSQKRGPQVMMHVSEPCVLLISGPVSRARGCKYLAGFHHRVFIIPSSLLSLLSSHWHQRW